MFRTGPGHALSRRAFLCGATGAFGLALGGCTMETALRPLAGDVPAPDTSFTPAEARVGDGAIGVGLLAADEVGSLSGGTPGSVYLSAKLAMHDLASDSVSLYIRDTGAGAGPFDAIVQTLMALKPGAIVGPSDAAATTRLAGLVADKSVLVLSLARVGNPSGRVYGAGVDYAAQATATVAEMGGRGFSEVIVATADQHGSQPFGDAIAAAAAKAGIAVRPARIPSPKEAEAVVGRAAGAGAAPSAVVFATSPELAARVLTARANSPRLAGLAVVGNAGWALAYLDPAIFRGAFYPTWPLEGVKAFADKFALAYSSAPTLEGLIAYDMTVLAAALPQMAEHDPYRTEILASAHGFTGQCGPFRFDPTTGLASRSYTIATVA